MELKVSIFDALSYLIPGLIYFFIIVINRKRWIFKKSILERILKLHNESLANSASRFLALALFVRNLSFPFLLLALIIPLTYQYFSIKIICLLIFLFLLISISLLYRYSRFEHYSYKIVAEGIIALNLQNFNLFKEDRTKK